MRSDLTHAFNRVQSELNLTAFSLPSSEYPVVDVRMRITTVTLACIFTGSERVPFEKVFEPHALRSPNGVSVIPRRSVVQRNQSRSISGVAFFGARTGIVAIDDQAIVGRVVDCRPTVRQRRRRRMWRHRL